MFWIEMLPENLFLRAAMCRFIHPGNIERNLVESSLEPPLPRGLAFPLVFSAMTTVAASPCSFLTPLIFVGRPKITACRIDTCAHDRTTRVYAQSGANRGDKASERLDSRPENHPSLLARSTLSDNPRAASSLPVACTRCLVAWRNLVVLLPRRMPIEFGGGGDQC